MLDPERVAEIEGKPVVDPDGEEIGTVADAYLNSSDDRPAWVSVEREGRRMLAPLDGATYEDEVLEIGHPADLVFDAPAVEGEAGVLAPNEEEELYAHYGLHDVALREDTGRPADLPEVGAPEPEPTGTSRDPRGGDGAEDAAQGHP